MSIDCMRYQVNVKFNKDFIDVDEDSKTITIGIRSKPVKGRANKEIIEKIADYFKVSSSSVEIVAGRRSKTKFVEII